MQTYLCVTCGTGYPPSLDAPPRCPICEDERQYIGLHGQQWTTLDALRATHRNTFFEEGDRVWGIATEPKFGIGQRALLVRVGNENILWDCIGLIDSDTVAIVRALG